MAMQPQKRRSGGSSRSSYNTSHQNVGAPIRRQNGNNRKQKSSFFGPILVLLILTLILALILAAAWQKFQEDEESSASQGMQLSDLLALSSSRDPNAPPASIPSVSMMPSSEEQEDDASSYSQDNTSVESSDSQQSSDTDSSSSQSSDSAPVTISTAAVYGVPVPVSEKVTTAYFDDALFVGDSITSGIESYGIMSNATVIANTGINPSTMLTSAVWETESGENVTLLDAAAQIDAKKIYVMIGANGIAWIGENTFVDYYSQIIQRLKDDHPDAIIYVQSILPVTKAKSDEGPAMSNGKIDIYNQRILEMTKELEVYYLNVAEAIKDSNGALPSEASPKDGIHFGTSTYQKWFDYLMTHTADNH